MNFNKIVILLITLFILSCSSKNDLSNKFFLNPEDGITIYDKDINVGLKATGGKTADGEVLARHQKQAKKHCNQYGKDANYVRSGAAEQGLGTNKYLRYEIYICVKA